MRRDQLCNSEAGHTSSKSMSNGLPSRREFFRLAGCGLMSQAGWRPNLGMITAASTSPITTKRSDPQLGYILKDVAREAHLDFLQVCGGDTSKKYILETTGSGVAFIDYDNDGWLDIFLVNGSRLDDSATKYAPTNQLFHNNRDGTFTDVTARAGLTRTGWGQGVCVGDYDNDGYEDIFVTFWGEDVLYHNNGDGTFTEVSHKAGVAGDGSRWSTGCAFLDYDRDGKLDLFVTHYVNFSLANAKDPGSNPYCIYRELAVNCGPRGLNGETSTLYRNNGDGTFTDVSAHSGILKPSGYFGLGVLVADFDNDGWPDIYVASDSTPSLLFMNNHDGTFREEATLRGVAFSEEGMEQAGMGVSAADYDHDGWLDILKTNFSDEVVNLYHNDGKAMFTNISESAKVNTQTHLVGWGCGFFDPDNDGFADLLYVNGHVYPELERIHSDTTYRQPRVLYRNLGEGRFEDVSKLAGSAIDTLSTGRGCAFGDFNNDGCVDVVINNQNATPSLIQVSRQNHNHWINIKLTGTQSNRSAIGARLKCVAGTLSQIDEVRSGGSYLSQNDLRIHFGLAEHATIDRLEIRWPSGSVDRLRTIPANQFVGVEEGGRLTTLRRGR
jgi:enediyne biosynthesis protein E4